MIVNKLIDNLRICANNKSCYGCTYYSSCELGNEGTKQKNKSVMMENAADIIEAFQKILMHFNISIENFYPYEFNESLNSSIIDRIYDACERDHYERHDIEYYNWR